MTWKYGRQTPDNNLMRFVARRFFENVSMLDIGSGEGANARELRLRGHCVVTLDRDPDTEPTVCVDIRDALGAEAGNPFDLIYDINTLCHVENPPFEKIKSWLKPHGIFFTIWPAAGTWPGVKEGKDYTRLIPSRLELYELLECFQGVNIWKARAPTFCGSDEYLDSWIAEARP